MLKSFFVLILIGVFATPCFSAEQTSPPSFPAQTERDASVVEVPGVIGLQIGKAREILEAARLKVNLVDIPRNLSAEKINQLPVMQQLPPAGWKLKAGAQITLSPLEQKQGTPQFKTPAEASSSPGPKPATR